MSRVTWTLYACSPDTALAASVTLLLTLPSGTCTLRMASLGLRLAPLSNLYPLSQLERASGFMATSLAAEALKNDILHHQHLENQRIRGDVLQWQPRKV